MHSTCAVNANDVAPVKIRYLHFDVKFDGIGVSMHQKRKDIADINIKGKCLWRSGVLVHAYAPYMCHLCMHDFINYDYKLIALNFHLSI